MHGARQPNPAILSGHVTSKNPAAINNDNGPITGRNRIGADIINAVNSDRVHLIPFVCGDCTVIPLYRCVNLTVADIQRCNSVC